MSAFFILISALISIVYSFLSFTRGTCVRHFILYLFSWLISSVRRITESFLSQSSGNTIFQKIHLEHVNSLNTNCINKEINEYNYCIYQLMGHVYMLQEFLQVWIYKMFIVYHTIIVLNPLIILLHITALDIISEIKLIKSTMVLYLVGFKLSLLLEERVFNALLIICFILWWSWGVWVIVTSFVNYS